jgi:hypothetical protein
MSKYTFIIVTEGNIKKINMKLMWMKALVYKEDCVKLNIKIYNAFFWGPSYREALSYSLVS